MYVLRMQNCMQKKVTKAKKSYKSDTLKQTNIKWNKTYRLYKATDNQL